MRDLQASYDKKIASLRSLLLEAHQGKLSPEARTGLDAIVAARAASQSAASAVAVDDDADE